MNPHAQGLRPLGLPRPLAVEVDGAGLPAVVRLEAGRRAYPVEGIEEVWRIAEAWWREAPIRRTYYRVLIDGGRALTLFRDEGDGEEGGGAWYEQRY